MALLTWLFPTGRKPPWRGAAALKAFRNGAGHAGRSKRRTDAAEVALAFDGMEGSRTYAWPKGAFRLFVDVPRAGMLAARTKLTSALKEPRAFFAFCERQ